MIVSREIPLGPTPMRFTINLLGSEYRMQTQYRDAPEAGWILDIEEAASREPIVHGIPLVTGADLMEQYEYLGLNFGLRVLNDLGEDPPTFNNLGVSTHLMVEFDDGT